MEQKSIIDSCAERFDFLRLRKDAGNKCAFTLYALGNFALLLILSSVVIFIQQSNPNQKLVQQQRHDWLSSHSAQKFFDNKNTLYASLAVAQTKRAPMKLFQQDAKFNGILDETVGLTTASQIKIPQQYYQIVYNLQEKQLQQDKQSSEPNNDLCVAWEIQESGASKSATATTTLLTDTPCTQTLEGLPIKEHFQGSIRLQDLQKMGVCETEDCANYCLQQEGHIVQQDSCYGDYYIQDFCAVVIQNGNNGWRVDNEKGCYDYASKEQSAAHDKKHHLLHGFENGQQYKLSFYKYELKKNQNKLHFTVTLRHVDDPLLYHNVSKTEITELQNTARFTYLVGSGLFFLILIAIIVIKKRVQQLKLNDSE